MPKKIIGYELFAMRLSGHTQQYRIACKAEVREFRAELRAWINAQPTKWRMVCAAITE